MATTKRQLYFYMQNTQKIQVPVTLKRLWWPLLASQIAELERIHKKKLGEETPAQSASAIYTNKNRVSIHFYLTH